MRKILTIILLLAINCWAKAQSTDSPLDVTDLVANAACGNATGWLHHSGEKAGTGGSNYAKNVALFNSQDYSGTGIESWTPTAVKSTELIYQDINVPAGTYRLEACVVAQVYVSDTQHGTNSGGIFLFMGDQQVECKSTTWKKLTLDITVPTSGAVRLGVKSDATNKNTWISLADVHLYATSITGDVQKVSLNENYDTYAINTGLLADITLYKYFPADRYVTLCLPVALGEDMTKQLFASVKSITSAQVNANQIDITTSEVSQIEPYKVYLVKANKETDGLTNIGKHLISKVLPTSTKCGDATLIGTFRTRDHVEGSYVLNATGSAFVPVKGRGKIKGFGGFFVK